MRLPESLYKSNLRLFVLMIACLFIPQTAFAQTEKLGTVKYTPPKGWNKTVRENVAQFSEINQATGNFCIITLHGVTPSSGSPASDFANEWNKLVVEPLKAEANPKTETELADGWTVTGGGAAVEIQGGKAFAFLTVLTGFGKTVSVVAVLNERSYLPHWQ